MILYRVGSSPAAQTQPPSPTTPRVWGLVWGRVQKNCVPILRFFQPLLQPACAGFGVRAITGILVVVVVVLLDAVPAVAARGKNKIPNRLSSGISYRQLPPQKGPQNPRVPTNVQQP